MKQKKKHYSVTFSAKMNNEEMQALEQYLLKHIEQDSLKIVENTIANKNSYKFKKDKQGNVVYQEFSGGSWFKYNYDEAGNLLMSEDNEGYYEKYDIDGNVIETNIGLHYQSNNKENEHDV